MNNQFSSTIIKTLNRRTNNAPITVYTDATGGIVRPVIGSRKVIFYYALILTYKNTMTDVSQIAFPISEMLTERHDIESIKSWLDSTLLFFRNKLNIELPIFKRIITDKSFANLNAICESFNNCRFSQYLQDTYNFVTKSLNIERYTIIHLCCAHLMKNLSDDIKANYSSDNTSKIIIEIIASVFNIDCYETIQDIWKNVSILLKNEYNTSDVENSLKSILNLTVLFIPIEEKEKQPDDVKLLDERELAEERKNRKVLYRNSPWFKDMNTITKDIKVESNSQNDEKNTFFNLKLLDLLLKKYLAFLPLWSGLLNEKGVRYSNSYIENYFGKVKFEIDSSKGVLGFGLLKTARFLRFLNDRNIYI